MKIKNKATNRSSYRSATQVLDKYCASSRTSFSSTWHFRPCNIQAAANGRVHPITTPPTHDFPPGRPPNPPAALGLVVSPQPGTQDTPVTPQKLKLHLVRPEEDLLQAQDWEMMTPWFQPGHELADMLKCRGNSSTFTYCNPTVTYTFGLMSLEVEIPPGMCVHLIR